MNEKQQEKIATIITWLTVLVGIAFIVAGNIISKG